HDPHRRHDRADRRQVLRLSAADARSHLPWMCMAIATATSLDVYVGGKLLFGDVSFKLEPGDRMTLSGRNGAGKSTLLRVLNGELTPEEGSVSIQRGARVALHDQRPPRNSATTSSPAARTCSTPRPSWPGSRVRWRAAPRKRRWPPTPSPSHASK